MAAVADFLDKTSPKEWKLMLAVGDCSVVKHHQRTDVVSDSWKLPRSDVIKIVTLMVTVEDLSTVRRDKIKGFNVASGLEMMLTDGGKRSPREWC